MNEVTFLTELIKTKRAALEGSIEPNAIITGQRLVDGSYHVLSRYADTIWFQPDILFPAGSNEFIKK